MLSKREQFGEKFIYFILVFWLGTSVLLDSTIEHYFLWDKDIVNQFVDMAVLVMLILQIVFFQKYQIRELVIIGIISVLLVIVTVNSDNRMLMSTMIFVIASKYIDFDRFIKIAYFVQLLMFAFVVWLYLSAAINDVTFYRGDIVRHSFGFTHPNQFGIRAFLLVVERGYIRRDKLNFIDFSVTLFAAYEVNIIANSKTCFYSLLFFAVLIMIRMIARYGKIDLGRLSTYYIITAIGASVMSVFLSIIDVRKYSFFSIVDSIISQRFHQCYRTYKYYGISWWGEDIQLFVKRPSGKIFHFWLDNAYVAMLLRYGIIVFVGFSLLYIFTMIKLKSEGRYMLVEIMCLYSLYGIMENNYFSVSQNLFLLLLGGVIYGYNTAQEKLRIKIVFG
jgi:hypothetical protein